MEIRSIFHEINNDLHKAILKSGATKEKLKLNLGNERVVQDLAITENALIAASEKLERLKDLIYEQLHIDLKKPDESTFH